MVSIITVNYRVSDKLIACIESIINSSPKNAYEIIVVDNSRDEKLYGYLNKNFKRVKYFPSDNKGFGQGNNYGAAKAQGEFLFFLNPDTLVYKDTIDNLVNFYKEIPNIGIAAPLLLGKNEKPYQQGSEELTPLKALFVLSVINKIFPNNFVSKRYFLSKWDRKSDIQVDVAPGTAFLISEKMYKELNGFDEKFFLFFEEFDLCKRVREAGYKIYITTSAKVLHYWGESTKQRSDIQGIFTRSRYYYFRKHFGVFKALAVEAVLRTNKETLSIVVIVALFLLLILYLV